MHQIKVEHPNEERRKDLGIPDQPKQTGPWAVWECGPSAFNWHYDETEIAYLYQGKVKVLTKKQTVELKAGDYVTFPKDLSCRWEVFEKVKKVYKFV